MQGDIAAVIQKQVSSDAKSSQQSIPFSEGGGGGGDSNNGETKPGGATDQVTPTTGTWSS